jgi:ubiquitin C-terminal hydrolase
VSLISKLVPKSKIMIVHINRFSHSGTSTIKLLPTEPIQRKFLEYSLVGIICHKGRNVEHGHYIYYHQINRRRWVVMNDLQTEEFELSQDDEMFEKEWKEEMTPFILFYQNEGM